MRNHAALIDRGDALFDVFELPSLHIEIGIEGLLDVPGTRPVRGPGQRVQFSQLLGGNPTRDCLASRSVHAYPVKTDTHYI